MYTDVKDVYEKQDCLLGSQVSLQGWIRNHRRQKEVGFIDFFDGTYFKSIQLVYDHTVDHFEDISKFRIGSAITVTGTVVTSTQREQPFEISVNNIVLEGDSPEQYPIQPKRHTREFLREIAYLRPRTNLFQAVFKVRSVTAMAIHTYFQERGYVYVHTPIFTANDGEGAGEMFQVTTLDLSKTPHIDGKVDYKRDFFGKKVGLTVTGQLEAEAFALAYKRVYTFGPTFRAENSNTKIHASEFWMIEPEISFCNLEQLMDIEEDTLRFVVKYVLDHADAEMKFLDQFVQPGLLDRLQHLLNGKATRITHSEAIDLLQQSGFNFENEPIQGEDLAKEHEKYLTEHFNGPVFVTDWPKEIKAFYMKQNPDGKTVAAVDLLVPGAGELMGGSQREENYEALTSRMEELGMSLDGFDWYLNLRRFGGCEHSGFGIGFDRLLIYLTGVDNIRDVIPFPRTPNNCEF